MWSKYNDIYGSSGGNESQLVWGQNMDCFSKPNIFGYPLVNKLSCRKWSFIVDVPLKKNDFPWFSIVMLVYQRVILVASSPSSLADDLFFPEGLACRFKCEICGTYFLGLVRMRYTRPKKNGPKGWQGLYIYNYIYIYIVGNWLNPQRWVCFRWFA